MARVDDRTAAPVDDTKRDVLRTCDLNLIGTAANYDLADKADRQRSADELATFFFRAAKALAPELFIEAGAKDASSSRRATRYLDNARVVAFEANPYTYRRFQRRNPADSGVEYVHLALSDRPGQVSFHVRLSGEGRPRSDGHGSLMDRDDDYGHEFTEVTVEATTLDQFFAGDEFDSCALWVDVEGAAGPVLTGGQEVIRKASIMIVEVEDGRKWKGAWTKPDVESFLYDAGLVPIARDFEYAYQYNMVFVREHLLADPELRLRLAQHLSTSSRGGIR